MIRTQLSPCQRDIWVGAAQFPESIQYTLFCYDRLVCEVDEEALRHAMVSVARRTDAFGLRLREEDGEPFQWFAGELDVSITTLALAHEYDFDAYFQARLRNAFGFSYALGGSQLADLFNHKLPAGHIFARDAYFRFAPESTFKRQNEQVLTFPGCD